MALPAAFGLAVAADSTLLNQNDPAHGQPQDARAAQAATAGQLEQQWFSVQAESSEYKDATGPEMVLVGRISVTGGHPVGQPEKMQWFEVLEVFRGEAQVGQSLDLRYSFGEGRGGDISRGQHVIWVVINRDDTSLVGYGAIPDTPNNRQAVRELAKRLNKTGP